MNCAHCGSVVTAHLARCPICGRGVNRLLPDVATAVLTPVPRSGDAAETGTILPVDDAATLPPIPSKATRGSATSRSVDQETAVPVPGAVQEQPATYSAPTMLPRAEAPTDPGADRAGPVSRPASGGPLGIGQAFGTRYHIIKLLGLGGMGAVYQAWDAELGVAVALKVIRPEVAADPSAARDLERRFKRELLLARQVTHKNVVRIHDLGEIGGIKYITMPFVDGEDLATTLKREGNLPVPRALRIARGVISGLRAAHEAGVVHRDLKPANIMTGPDDDPMIMDFGIALSQGVVGGGPAPDGSAGPAVLKRQAALIASQTMAGSVVGTIQYMAPEQARGQAVDQRADIYAFGLIVYDMIVGGRRSERATNALEELQARMQQAPPGPRTVDPSIPEGVDRIITRCLEPDPDKRFQTTAELADELDRLDADGNPLPIVRRVSLRVMLSAVAAMLVALVATWWFARAAVPPAEHPPMSVLVADFENQTGDPVFNESVEQALSMAMEGASFVSAYPRSGAQAISAQLKPGSHLDEAMARLVSKREGVQVILAGTISRGGAGYTVSIRAIDPGLDPGQKPLATVTASVPTKERMLSAVASIASRVRGALGDQTPESARLAAADTFTASSLDAVQIYSRAQQYHQSGRKAEALETYKRAIEQDPNFGLAYSGAAIMAFELGRIDEAQDLWKRALSLMDRMTERERYRTLAGYYLGVTRNYEKAIENYKALVTQYPADRSGHANLALAYFWSLNIPKALEVGRRAVELDPKNTLHRSNYSLYAMYAGDFETAEKETRKVLEEQPNFYVAYVPLAMAALARNDVPAAAEAYSRMAETGAPGASLGAMGLADIALYEGRYGDAESILEEAIKEDEKADNTAGLSAKYVALAEACEGQGKKAQAIAAATKALNLSQGKPLQVPAAAVLLKLGSDRTAASIGASMSQQLQPQTRAYGKLLQGRVALKEKRMVDATDAFLGAQKLADLWMIRFDLGVAYIEAGHFAEGLAELQTAEKRRGEATAIFLDEVPSFRYLATLPYWLGRAQQELGMTSAATANYKAYLALRSNAPRDPLAADAKKRFGA